MSEDQFPYKLYQINRTILQMLRDRKYIVSKEQLEMKFPEFREQNNDLSRTSLELLATKIDDPSIQILVFFPEDEKVSVEMIRSYVEKMKEHQLVPKHEVLSEEESKVLLKRYRVKPTQLPRIKVTDPVARYLGLRRGQIVKITRPSETAGRYAFEQKKRVYQKKQLTSLGFHKKSLLKKQFGFQNQIFKGNQPRKTKKKNTVNVQNKGNKDIEIETEIGIENENENEMGKEMQSKSGFEEKYYSTLNAESAQGSGSGSEHQPDPDVRFLGKSSGFNQQRGKLSERKTRTISKPSTIAQHSSLKKIKKAQQKSGTNSINKFEGRTEFELFPTENNQRLLLTDTQEVLDFIFGDLQKLHKRDYQETTQENKQTMLKKKKIVQRNLRITSLDLKLPRNKKSFEIKNRLKYSQESLDFLDAYINRSKKFLNKFCKNRSMKVDIEAKNW